MKNQEHFIHYLWINQKEGKIEIYINILERVLIFYGKRKVKLDGITVWHALARQEYRLGDGEMNFETICKTIYNQMEENLVLINGVQAFLAETTQIEIKGEED